MFPVIHIHLGNDLPPHFLETVTQTRRFHKGPIYLIVPSSSISKQESERLDCTIFDWKQWQNNPKIKSLKQFSFLDNYDNGKGFWRVTLERLFYLECCMNQENLRSALHLENDVLIYFEPETYLPVFKKCYGESIAVTPLGPSEGCTAAIMYVGSLQALQTVTSMMVDLLSKGENELTSILGSPMVHEMMLLGIINKKNPDLLKLLPTLPHPITHLPYAPRRCKPWQRPVRNLLDALFPRYFDLQHKKNTNVNFEAFDSVFDSGTWGQAIDGTPKKPGKPTFHRHHWIAGDLKNGLWKIVWKSDIHGRKTPYVTDKKGTVICQLNNLHLHSKRMSLYM
jgi:hypothetical protein